MGISIKYPTSVKGQTSHRFAHNYKELNYDIPAILHSEKDLTLDEKDLICATLFWNGSNPDYFDDVGLVVTDDLIMFVAFDLKSGDAKMLDQINRK